MQRLRKLREKKHLNQQGLAMKLHLSQSTVSAYEIGERTPDMETLIEMAKFFDVSIDYLVGLTDVKYQTSERDLPQEEAEHLHKFRQLDETAKDKLSAYMDGLSDR